MKSYVIFFSICCLTLAIGCSDTGRPPLGDVSGILTIDGEPVENAVIRIYHDEGGRAAEARTDMTGYFRMIYKDRPVEHGVKVGPSTVMVATKLDEDDQGGPRHEMLPAKYRGKESILKFVVPDGDVTLDLPLTSDGSFSLN